MRFPKPIIKRFAQFAFVMGLIASLFAAWIGYGNPWREVPIYKFVAGEDISYLFYVDHCKSDGTCEVPLKYRRLLHFSFGGEVQGDGNNPISQIREMGFTAIPSPTESAAALKWCTDSHILEEFRHDGRHYIVPLTDNPIRTAQCVKDQISGSFSVCIAEPMGQNEDCERFSSLADQ